VEIDIIYKYHAPEERLLDATTIATATTGVEDNEIWTNLHPVGEVISFRADDPRSTERSRKSTWSLSGVPCRPRSGIPATRWQH
jgi:hypothetical protein